MPISPYLVSFGCVPTPNGLNFKLFGAVFALKQWRKRLSLHMIPLHGEDSRCTG